MNELRHRRSFALPHWSLCCLCSERRAISTAGRRDLTEIVGRTYPHRNMAKVVGVKNSIFSWFLLEGSEAVWVLLALHCEAVRCLVLFLVHMQMSWYHRTPNMKPRTVHCCSGGKSQSLILGPAHCRAAPQ